jgi:hypothetical protein
MSAIENSTPVKKVFKVKKTMPVEELDEEETAIVVAAPLPMVLPRATPLVPKTITIRVDEYEELLANKKQLDILLKKAEEVRAKKNAASKKCYEKKKKTVTAVKAKLEERIEKLEKVILNKDEDEVDEEKCQTEGCENNWDDEDSKKCDECLADEE